ncbi:MAG TPA: alpha/beta fold hydrolase [Gemmatimonadales bacterium]|nr:alpha/beta fold hydrolase [Gemmatimonadales bacterium]
MNRTVRVPVEDVELSVQERGEGPALLLVHGFPFDHGLWRHQLKTFPGWRRIAPDLRGAGGSSAPDNGYSMARYADDLIAVLDAMDVAAAVVCGLSMGGYVIFELLRRYRARVRAAILCDTKAEADTDEGKRGRDEMIALARGEGAASVADKMVPALLAPDTRAERPEVEAQVREMIGRAPVAGIVGALTAMRDRVDSTPLLSELRVPVLVVAGASDGISTPEGGAAMAGKIKGARFATVAGAGHLPPLEQPFVTTRLIADFLKTVL